MAPFVKPQQTLKAEKTELQSEVQSDSDVTQEVLADQDAAAIAGHLELPLSRIDEWTPEQKRTWLKCMLVKHINWQAMEPAQREATAQQLNVVNDLLQTHLNASLDSLISLVEFTLTCQVLGQILQNELAVWRRAGRRELQQSTSNWRRHQLCSSFDSENGSGSSSGSSGSSSGGGRRGNNEGDLLWEHILRLLETGNPAVRWVQPDLGRFQFVSSTSAARSWGGTKRNRNMSFEKMSRSIRQYYRPKSGLMLKVPNKGRLQYQFNVTHPQFVRFLKENFPNSACLARKL